MKYLTALLLAAVSSVSAQTITSVGANGSGCPTGSTIVDNSSGSHLAINVASTDFVATFPGSSAAQRRRNCQLTVGIAGVPNVQYTVSSGTYTGNVNLGAGVTATQTATYFWSSSGVNAVTSNVFTGAISQDYTVVEAVPSASQVWSTCGSASILNANNAIALTGSGTGTASAISGGNVRFDLTITSRSC